MGGEGWGGLEGGGLARRVPRRKINDFILFFQCNLTKPMIPPDVFLGISTFMMRKVKISDDDSHTDLPGPCPDPARICPDLPGSSRVW